jgi:hypothetical protein
MKFLSAVAALTLLATIGAAAQTTNTLSNAEIQGRQLAQKLLAQQPTESFTNAGVLQIRNAGGNQDKVYVSFLLSVNTTNWESSYLVPTADKRGVERLVVSHRLNQPNQYFYGRTFWPEQSLLAMVEITPTEAATKALAGSDFSLSDLGLEFLHWPGQKILRGDTARGRLCKVLESTNPNPSTNSYSRVLSWIDNESLGIVEAKAYDASGKLLKEFYPKDIKKVDGQWQVGSMEIDNIQTGSRTRLEFDLKKQ